MNQTRVALATVAVCLIVIGLVGAAFAASPSFVAYQVTIQSGGYSRSLILNESVRTTQNSSFEILVLNVISSGGNLSYSRQVNSTLQPFPFLPGISNQNFTLAYGSYELSAKVARNGTISKVFQGGSYELASYTFGAQASSSTQKGTTTGSFATFPSGLLYSVRAEVNGTTSLAIILLSTSLPLEMGGSNPALQTASVGLGAGAVVSVLALSLGIRYKRKQKQPESKPDYWVD